MADDLEVGLLCIAVCSAVACRAHCRDHRNWWCRLNTRLAVAKHGSDQRCSTPDVRAGTEQIPVRADTADERGTGRHVPDPLVAVAHGCTRRLAPVARVAPAAKMKAGAYPEEVHGALPSRGAVADALAGEVAAVLREAFFLVVDIFCLEDIVEQSDLRFCTSSR